MSGHHGGHPGGGPGNWPPVGPAGGDVFSRQYAAGTAPWDIGRPQPEMVALEEAGTFGPRVLDVGCGRGALSIYLAERGHQVLGIDGAEQAVESARKAVEGKDLDAVFVLGDVIEVMGQIHDSFDAVVDVGFFHALEDSGRALFETQLARVLAPGGVYAMLAFSDRVPGAFGPRRVSEAEIRETLGGSRWRIREIRPAELHSAMPQMPVVDANLAVIERL
jgi:2-polyprenyl-3-methyl-5-hydroxy-6-metoxy-1,4-benzoquinol methylase